MKYFLLPIRNQINLRPSDSTLRCSITEVQALFGQLVLCLVASPMGWDHTQLTLASILAISFGGLGSLCHKSP